MSKTKSSGQKTHLLRLSLLSSFLFFSSCATTQVGIGSSNVNKVKNGIVSYEISYETGFEIAESICKTVFDQSTVTEDGSGIRVYHDGKSLGSAGAFVYPVLVENTEDNTERGMLFRVHAFGEGYNYSFVPKFMCKKFFNELDKVARQRNLQTISFKNYKEVKDVLKLEHEIGDFGKFAWKSYGNAQWFVTSEEKNSGRYSAQAGKIGDNETTSLSVALDCVTGYISFYAKVSCQPALDCLGFYIDGVEKGTWSGERDWRKESFHVMAGRRTFTWTFTKDNSVSEGADTAWIDDIVFPRR